ncbi:hypothetical protein EG329_005691 [Mollisiaceae sp. DMI_Dod_QoI]|nr:hypothetical protein EG329_005691 [Helotiales sp. DMI_Dod_QoI]
MDLAETDPLWNSEIGFQVFGLETGPSFEVPLRVRAVIGPGREAPVSKRMILAPQDQRTSDTVRGTYRPISRSTFSDEGIALAQDWIDAKHIKLIDTSTNRPTGRYCTVSHRWGIEPFLNLSHDNLEAFMIDIPFSRLPKTFQDAILVVLKLGIHYLWIDSLCILQSGLGSKEDWQKESAQMHKVYENSYCNIAATAASNSKAGLFFERDTFQVESCKIDMKADGVAHSWYLFDRQVLDRHNASAPLSERAWVIQEYLFSPRILHFGKEQLFWECSTLYACESRPLGFGHDVDFVKKISALPVLGAQEVRKVELTHAAPSPTSTDTKVDGIDNEGTETIRAWTQTVERYSSCQLTNDEDKLIAISGIAERYHKKLLERSQCRYLAGVWSGTHLISSLMWSPSPRGDSFRPNTYRAPSWSWASMQGRIFYNYNTILLSRHAPRVPVAAAMDSSVSLASDNPYGQVLDGRLTMQGPMLWVRAEAFGGSLARLKRKILLENLEPSGLNMLYLDEAGSDQDETYLLLGLVDCQGLGGLALKASENDSYKRVGLFWLHTKAARELVMARQRENITII